MGGQGISSFELSEFSPSVVMCCNLSFVTLLCACKSRGEISVRREGCNIPGFQILHCILIVIVILESNQIQTQICI
jgi:hypothetical protein